MHKHDNISVLQSADGAWPAGVLPLTSVDSAGMVARWPLINGSIAEEVSGRSTVWYGTEMWVEDLELGQAVPQFVGSNYLSFSDTGLPGAPYTMLSLVKFTGVDGGWFFYGATSGTNVHGGFQHSGETVMANHWGSNLTAAPPLIHTCNWHWIATTNDGTVDKLYVDGRQAAYASQSLGTALSGAGEIGRYGQVAMYGFVADCRIYNVAKTAEQLLAVAQFKA